MSVKSLLQLILFLLIIVIVGGIYFLYFYKGPLKNKEVLNNTLIEIDNSNKNLNSSTNDEILEEIDASIKDNNLKKEINENISVTKKKFNKKNEIILNKNHKNQLNKKNDNDKVKNLTKNIEYVTSNKNGDIFKISAKYGKTNIENSNILDLEKVEGIISSKNRSEIFITSNYAEYNYDNQNSKFYRNVELKYDNKIITCNNLDLIISDNIAVAYENVIVKDESSIMKAQMITFDIITKDIIINSDKKIKLITN